MAVALFRDARWRFDGGCHCDRRNGGDSSAGVVVLFDTEAFAYEWAGPQLPVPIRLHHRRRRQSMTITLPDSFGGRLFLALNFTHGEDIAYSLSVPANTSVLITVQAPCPISCGHTSLSPRLEAAETGPVRALRAGLNLLRSSVSKVP